jgi:molybdopterin-guanine dinucleotide biosynthesis protein A
MDYQRATRAGVLILTGGTSSRMGANKAELDWCGRGALDRLAALAAKLGLDELVVVGPGAYGLPSVVESPPGGGPVAGMLTGLAELAARGCRRALVLAVDAPTLAPSDIAPLLASNGPGAAYEGLHLPLVVDLSAAPLHAEAGWPVSRFIAAAGLARLDCPPGSAQRLRGANTPAERDALLAMLADVERDTRSDGACGTKKLVSVTDQPQLFAFEDDFVVSLRCIPMAVRMKLDRCRIKLSLRQWSRFTATDRRRLLESPCRTSEEVAAYHDGLTQLVSDRAGEAATPLSDLPEALWEVVDAPPAVIVTYARSAGLTPPTAAQWRGLTELQRYALIKLTREGHDNINFIPAMREFGVTH